MVDIRNVFSDNRVLSALTYQPCWHSLHAHRAFVIAASHFVTVALI
jgi:hypothetical protein